MINRLNSYDCESGVFMLNLFGKNKKKVTNDSFSSLDLTGILDDGCPDASDLDKLSMNICVKCGRQMSRGKCSNCDGWL